jgi:peptidyl-prolyl cis-trans isomerase D
MAIIQKIRNRAGVLVSIIIGMALFAFILGDFLTSGSKIMNRNRTVVVEINGDEIQIEEYQKKINELEEITKMQSNASSLDEQAMEKVKQSVWQEVTQDKVMEREYEKLGLTVHNDELYDLIGGEHPHPYIQQFFGDPKTGMVDKERVRQFLSQINQVEDDNPNKKVWLYIEDLIYNDRELTKYRNLLLKGLYATSLETKRKASEFSKTVDFSYLVKKYSEMSDSTVSISESDVKAYYKKNKEAYKQKASREIKYVIWEVKPSQNDYAEAKKWTIDVAKELSNITAKDSWQYIQANSDEAPSTQNFSKGQLPARLDSFAFSSTAGAIYGPYFENESYKLARLIDVVYTPDSVKASHILLQPTQENVQQVQSRADSILKAIKNGADFEALARKFSVDGGSRDKGGELGWFKEGRMTKPFNDTCFLGKTGDVKLVNSQFGIHIVRIEEQSKPSKKVEVGVLTRKVQPSEATDQVYYSQASAFGSTNNTASKFNSAVNTSKDLKVQTVSVTTLDENLPDVDRSREIIRWAFDSKQGEVTPKVYQFDNKYVFALLTKAREEGYAPIADVRNQILVELRRQKQAEKLIAEFNSAKSAGSLSSIAAKLGTEVKTATNIRFTSYSVPGLGGEPKLIGAATSMEQGKVSQPIDGTNGVYFVQVDKVSVPDENQTNYFNKSFIERSYMSKVYTGAILALDDMAKIKDNRINFY